MLSSAFRKKEVIEKQSRRTLSKTRDPYDGFHTYFLKHRVNVKVLNLETNICTSLSTKTRTSKGSYRGRV